MGEKIYIMNLCYINEVLSSKTLKNGIKYAIFVGFNFFEDFINIYIT